MKYLKILDSGVCYFIALCSENNEVTKNMTGAWGKWESFPLWNCRRNYLTLAELGATKCKNI